MTHHTTAQRLKVPFSDVTMYLVCPCENLELPAFSDVARSRIGCIHAAAAYLGLTHSGTGQG